MHFVIEMPIFNLINILYLQIITLKHTIDKNTSPINVFCKSVLILSFNIPINSRLTAFICSIFPKISDTFWRL